MGRPPFDGKYEWMSGNPEDIGGRDPDFGQVAGSLNAMIRATYPVNGVPDDVARLLLDCAQSCRIAEERVKLLIETVSNDLNPDGGSSVMPPRPPVSTEDLRGIADLLDVQLGDSYMGDPPHIQLLALAVRDIARMLYGERSGKASSKGESNEQA